MIDFLIFCTCIVLGNSIYSLREYSKFLTPYKKLDYMNFHKQKSLLISNENSKDEFVIISEWNYRISSDMFLQFDIWTLLDLHKFYWILKFNSKMNKLELFK